MFRYSLRIRWAAMVTLHPLGQTGASALPVSQEECCSSCCKGREGEQNLPYGQAVLTVFKNGPHLSTKKEVYNRKT